MSQTSQKFICTLTGLEAVHQGTGTRAVRGVACSQGTGTGAVRGGACSQGTGTRAVRGVACSQGTGTSAVRGVACSITKKPVGAFLEINQSLHANSSERNLDSCSN